MSSFKDTFTKEDGGEKNLDYDDSAFYYFAAVLLMVMILPLLYSFVKYKVFRISDSDAPQPLKDLDKAKACGCSICECKKSTKHLSMAPSFGVSGCLQLSFLLVLVYLFVVTCQCIQESPEGIKVFDPYEILGLPMGAPQEKIKPAFRELSKKFHPDKNRGDPFAQSKFIMITKAYETLTDERARENYEKYGNPDGPSPLKFAIGLPRFLLKTENHVSILVVFFVIIVIFIPGSVLLWINTSKRLDKNGVLQDNHSLYYTYLNENLNLKSCLMMIAASLEFEGIKAPMSESVELKKLRMRYLDNVSKKKNLIPRVLKVTLMLLAYMDRRELSKSMKADLDVVLKISGNLIESMIDMALYANMIPRAKRMSARTFIMLIEMSQLLTQGISLHGSNLLMIPHIDESTFKLLSTKKKAKLSDISGDFDKLTAKFSPEEMQDIQEAYRHLPKLKVKAEAIVEGEEDIAVGDIVTLKVTIERTQLQDDQKVGPIHSNTFPLSKVEKIWILFIEPESGKLLHITSVLSLEKVIVEDKFKFPIGPNGFNIPPGKQRWEVHVKSDAYYGLDIVAPLEFEVLRKPSTENEIFVHPDDENIENQTTWIQSVMSGMQPEHHSSEEEEEIPELVDEAEEDNEVE